ncbi:hypothetical protein TNIN_45651 [Trichonephila inaurata madagascariensis]|uniref:Uncharacterized protein n=1 Tax=Trichonephila inaurata madagascariensis TaxID=2747483 RepID=A0A8X6YYR6_9ARAC|nr:hypothetical protein TNIN_45651 [Trichonephila inaurata madagascariensis]
MSGFLRTTVDPPRGCHAGCQSSRHRLPFSSFASLPSLPFRKVPGERERNHSHGKKEEKKRSRTEAVERSRKRKKKRIRFLLSPRGNVSSIPGRVGGCGNK